jgi:excisionase family DNA binding protein
MTVTQAKAAIVNGAKFFENRITGSVLLTAMEMAEMLSINRNQLYKLVRRKLIPVVRIGRALRFEREAVIDLLRSQSCLT